MKNLSIALRSLFKKGRSNGIKVLSLGSDWQWGLCLYRKFVLNVVCKFYPDSDRIYRLTRKYHPEW